MCEELIGDSTIFDCQIRGEKLLFFERAPFHWSTAAAPCRAGFCHTERAGPACTRARPLAEPVPLGQQSALRRAVCTGQRARHSCLLRLRIDGHTRQSDLPVPPPPPPRGVRMFALHVCVSVSALQIRSSIPFFSSFHIYALIYDREKSLNSSLKQIPSPVFMTIW